MKIRVLFQPQNCAAYVDKNQLQKCYQKINSEQEPGTQAFFFKFLFNLLLQRQQRKRVKQLLRDISKTPFLFLFF